MIRTMKLGSSALLAVVSSATIFFCILALGAVDAVDSDLLLRMEIPPLSHGQRQLLSFDYTAEQRSAVSSLRAIATVDTTEAMSLAAALILQATCSKCQWQ